MDPGQLNRQEVLTLLYIIVLLAVPMFFFIVYTVIECYMVSKHTAKTSKPYNSEYTMPEKTVYNMYEDRPSFKNRPPRATFFSRINGKETLIEGPCEEDYLNSWETMRWKITKKIEKRKKSKE